MHRAPPLRSLHLDSVDSTNLEALRRFAEEPSRPLLVSAGTQSAGRGRQGRAWQSPVGGLWMSLAWPLSRPQAHYAAAGLAAGLAAAEALEAMTGLALQIKWPNDLLAGGRKLAGLLGELHVAPLPLLVLGIGVNANFRPEALGPGLLFPPTTLLEQLGRPVDLAALREALGAALAAGLAAFDVQGLAPLLPRLERRLPWRGRLIRFTGPGGSVTGTLLGLDPAGRLAVEVEGRVEHYASGDLSGVRAEQA